MRHPGVRWHKAEQMVLYMCHKSKRDPRFGAVKLAKLMFYSDFLAYLHLGYSITGLEYKKLPQGPVPTQAKAIQNHLVASGQLYVREGTFGREQLVPYIRFQRSNFLKVFTEDELELMDQVFETIRPMKAAEVSDLSHRFFGWRVADMGEVIPYSSALIEPRPLSSKELEYGQRLAQRLGLG